MNDEAFIAARDPRLELMIVDNEAYTISFESTEIEIKEGEAADVKLTISPQQSTHDRLTVSLINAHSTVLIMPATVEFARSADSATISIMVNADNVDDDARVLQDAVMVMEDEGDGTTSMPRIKAGNTLTVIIGISGIRIKVKVYLEGALP